MKKTNYWNILTYIVYTIVIIFAFLAVSSKFSIGGFKIYVVKSGSMEPAIKTGSVVIDKTMDEYEVGDVITFKNKDKPLETTTHRIFDEEMQGNIKIFTTKGDANNSSDSIKVSPDKIVGKVIFKIPYFGYAVAFVRTLPGFIILIVIPATIIIYEEINKIHHETKQIIKKRKEKKLSKIKERELIKTKKLKDESKIDNKGENNETS